MNQSQPPARKDKPKKIHHNQSHTHHPSLNAPGTRMLGGTLNGEAGGFGVGFEGFYCV